MRLTKRALRKMMAAWWYGSKPAAPRRAIRAHPSWDFLEDRTVPSSLSMELHVALEHHVATSETSNSSSGDWTLGTGGTTATTSPAIHRSTPDTQLAADIKQLWTDVDAIRSESSVTMGQVEALRADFVALANSGLYPDGPELATFEHDLLMAVAASRTAGNNGTLTWTETRTLEAEAGTALGSSVAASIELSQLFNDMLAIAQNSNITMANILTITGDQAKIAADLEAMRSLGSSMAPVIAAGWSGAGGWGWADAADLATASVSSLMVPEFSGSIGPG
jgi:hypothetical protein